MNMEKLKRLDYIRDLKKSEFMLAMERLAWWRGELALNNYVVVKLKGRVRDGINQRRN